MDPKQYETIENNLKGLIEPTVKRAIRLTIKENLTKMPETERSLEDVLNEVEKQFDDARKIIFTKMRKDIMVGGIIQYSGYQEPKEDD
jgi:hypothetical protein